RRTARFRCVLALVTGMEDLLVVEGTCEGSIASAPRGKGGFGYDPLFLPSGEALTFAELTDERKSEISHRGRAAARLRELYQTGVCLASPRGIASPTCPPCRRSPPSSLSLAWPRLPDAPPTSPTSSAKLSIAWS